MADSFDFRTRHTSPGLRKSYHRPGTAPIVLRSEIANTVTLTLARDSLYPDGAPGTADPDPDDFEASITAPWYVAPTDASADGAKVAVLDEHGYRFVNLEPDTEYEIKVGMRGDDSTQSARTVRTLPAGHTPFYADLYLVATAAMGEVDLRWTDANDAGSGRYRVERSVDGGPFAEIERQPGSRTETADGLEPGWSGKQVAYRVFEWVGKQKLYSDEVSFVPLAR